MKTVQLGKDGPAVSRVGLGCMSMAGVYGPADDAESIATIHAAIDAGISLIDTGDFYGMGSNEILIGRALKERNRDDVTISVKFGALRGPDGAWNGYDARPAAVKNFLAYSLTRLGVDYIDIYRPARIDPNVPIEETMGAIKDLIDAGYVRHAGLSEAGPETIRRAASEAPVSDLQIEYSLVSRGIEDAILPVCRELGIAITAYGILSRGILGGRRKPGTPKRKGDIRARMPRYDAGNEEKNLALAEALFRVAQAKGMTTAQAAVAWVAAQGDDIVPLLGSRTREQLDDLLGGAEAALSAEDLAEIEKAVPKGAAAGDRYNAAQMAMLDSEK
ncbi:aldo/keto reductase [Oricola nitratireducens]|uniref:aldo/keto reductase n=1 Tax=Oricola nitratireducens TaxID=2775868 RepID=UPI0018679DAC|nr:aldo/keto reductase [Oricola nitratireducens]